MGKDTFFREQIESLIPFTQIEYMGSFEDICKSETPSYWFFFPDETRGENKAESGWFEDSVRIEMYIGVKASKEKQAMTTALEGLAEKVDKALQGFAKSYTYNQDGYKYTLMIRSAKIDTVERMPDDKSGNAVMAINGIINYLRS